MGIRNLDTPWHIDYPATDDGVKRHRSHCINYVKQEKRCKKYNSKCYGAAHCDIYEEEETPDVEIEKLSKLQKVEKKIEKISDDQGKKIYPIGTNVYHKKFGMGVVMEICDGYIFVDFKNDGTKRLSLKACIDNDYLI